MLLLIFEYNRQNPAVAKGEHEKQKNPDPGGSGLQ
jgi:hypothetical protein